MEVKKAFWRAAPEATVYSTTAEIAIRLAIVVGILAGLGHPG